MNHNWNLATQKCDNCGLESALSYGVPCYGWQTVPNDYKVPSPSRGLFDYRTLDEMRVAVAKNELKVDR